MKSYTQSILRQTWLHLIIALSFFCLLNTKLAHSQNTKVEVKLGDDYQTQALQYRNNQDFECFYQYCDSASNSFLEEKKLTQWLYSNILAIEHLNRTKQFNRAAKWIKKTEKKAWNPKTKIEYLHYGSFYMQKGFTALRLREYVESIEAYNTSIANYQNACKDEDDTNPYCINDTNAGLYLLLPQNESRLKLIQVDEVINSLSDDFLNHLKETLKTEKDYDPLAKLYNQKAEAYLRKRDTAAAHHYNKLRFELPKLGFEENVKARIDYANTLHLLEKKSQRASEILGEQEYKISTSSSLTTINKNSLLSLAKLFHAYVLRDMGNTNLAYDKSQESLELMQKTKESPNHPDLIRNYILHGGLLSKMKNYKKSRFFRLLGIQCIIPKVNNVSNLFFLKKEELISSYQLGQLFKVLGNTYSNEYLVTKNILLLDSALFCFKRMVQTEDLMKSSHVLESSRLYVSKRRSGYLNLALEACFELYQKTQNEYYLHDALYFMEKSRAQELELALKKAELIQTLRLDQELLELNTARLKRDEKRMELDLYKAPDEQENSQLAKFQLEYLTLKQAFDDTLKSLDPAYHSWLLNREPISFQEIRKTLTSTSVLMSFFEGKEVIYLLSLGKNNADFRKIHFTQKNLSEIDSLRLFLRNEYPSNAQKKAFEASSNFLYDKLFSQINSWPVKELICIPPAIFHNIPFEVLLTENKMSEDIGYRDLPYLWRKYQIRYQYLAQAEVVRQNAVSHLSPKFKYIGFAPDYSEQNSPALASTQVRQLTKKLTHNVKEIRVSDTIISSNKNSRVFVKDSASSDIFKQYASLANILHLAMHASAEKDSLPKLIFGNSQLNINQIYPLKLSSDLTILSACRTGLGEEIKGEGIMSLGRAFIYAGSKSVIESLWNVDDYSSQKFVPLFMKGIQSGLSKAEALNKARAEYLDSDTNGNTNMPPYYWSQFVLYGNNVTAVGSSKISTIAKYLFLLIFLIGGTYLYNKRRSKNNQTDYR